MNILSVENVCYRISSKAEDKYILRDISFCISEDEVLGITGESGAGKTTLAKIIAGHLPPSSGIVKLNITSINKSSPVQLLFQNTGDIINPYRKVTDVIKEAVMINAIPPETAQKNTERLLGLLKLNPELWFNRGYQLSGGEQQRVALARLLAVKPQLLILDEPFASQDAEAQVNLLNLLKEIKKEFKLAIICISHNIKLLRNFAGAMIVLRNGEIMESGDITEILKNPKNSYTKLLLKAENYNLSEEELEKILK